MTVTMTMTEKQGTKSVLVSLRRRGQNNIYWTILTKRKLKMSFKIQVKVGYCNIYCHIYFELILKMESSFPYLS